MVSMVLEFGEHPQRGSRFCVLKQKMGQRYMDTSRICQSFMRQYTSQNKEMD